MEDGVETTKETDLDGNPKTSLLIPATASGVIEHWAYVMPVRLVFALLKALLSGKRRIQPRREDRNLAAASAREWTCIFR
jgi:hypothetical protein